MKLILVRHGKAEKSVDGMDDAGRRLTSDGIAKLEKSMPHLQALIGEAKSIHLWSSPLLRATQSAKIISDYLRINEPTIYDFISSGDYSAFADALAKTDQDATLVIVGHQPWLSEWCTALCGADVPFKKGDAVPIAIRSLSPLSGKIDKSYSSELEKVMRYYLHEIQNAQIAFLAQPDDIENIHHLRVCIRKFRSLLSLIRPRLTLEDYLTYQGKMRNAGQLFSYLRDLDVLQTEWLKFVSEKTSGLKSPGELSFLLKSIRDQERAKLLTALANGVLTSTISDLELWLSDLKSVDDFKSKKALVAYANRRVKKWVGNIRQALQSIENTDLHNIHMLRIKCKKVRYIQDIFLLQPSALRHIGVTLNMKDLQESLGMLCDTQRNIEIIDSLFSANDSIDISNDLNLFISYLVGKRTGLTRSLYSNYGG